MFVETQIVLIFLFSLLTLNILQNKAARLFVSFLFSIFLVLEIISYYLTGNLIDYRFFFSFILIFHPLKFSIFNLKNFFLYLF